MNWKRGLFRSWVVLSTLWLTGWLAFAWLDPAIPSLTRDCSELRDYVLDDTGKALGSTDIEQCVQSWKAKRAEFLRYGFLPPIILLAIGVLVNWIIRGFSRHQESSVTEKVFTSFKRYILHHWRGEFSLTRAFFINGVLFYLLMLLLLLGLDRFVFGENGFLVMPMLLLFVVALAWSLVGITRSGIKVLRKGDTSRLQKLFAVIAISLVSLCSIYLVKDIHALFF